MSQESVFYQGFEEGFFRVLQMVSMEVTVKVVFNVGFFLLLLTWVLVELWKNRTRGESLPERVYFKEGYKVFTKTTVGFNVLIMVLNVGLCVYNVWNLKILSLESLTSVVIWALSSFVSFSAAKIRNTLWPIVLLMWWHAYVVIDMLMVYLYFASYFDTIESDSFVSKPSFVDVASFPLLVFLCYNGTDFQFESASELGEPSLPEAEVSEANATDDAFSKAGIWSKLTFRWLNPLFAIGMVCCEEEGRLKEKPLLLQSSVEHSGGQRVRLDLQKLSQFSIFPGQVIGIKGDNPSGHCLIASEIIDHVPLLDSNDENSQPSKKQALDKDLIQTDLSHAQSEISALIAGGPFTTTDNLMFEPLTELLAYARRKQPQLLILLGPFIDSEHPEIKKGTVNQTFDELFHHEILKRIQDHVEYMGSAARVILVPSIRDASHDLVFPQPPFSIHPPDLKDQITSITNPGTFSANEVKVACCTVDIIKQLSGEEISRNAAGGSKHRMSTLANHILCQRSFYPLYPPAEGIPLDFSLAPEALEISSIPDILILPSDLTHFVKVVSVGGEGEAQKKCLCVNPGRLARGEGGGFFVELNYHGSPDSATASVIRI